MSAYANTLVTMAENVGSTASVLFTPAGGNGCLVDVPEMGFIVAGVRSDPLGLDVVAGELCHVSKDTPEYLKS